MITLTVYNEGVYNSHVYNRFLEGGTEQALVLDGSRQYLATVNPELLGIDNTWSVGFWSKPRSGPEFRLLFAAHGRSGKNSIEISVPPIVAEPIQGTFEARERREQIRLRTTDENGNVIKHIGWGDVYRPDLWSHIGLVWDGNDILFYADGELASSGTAIFINSSGTMADSERKVYYGSNISGSLAPWSGTVGHGGMWSSALSAAEWQTVVSGGFFMDLTVTSGSYASQGSLEHYWKPGADSANIGEDLVGGLDLEKLNFVSTANIVGDRPGL